VEQRGGRRPAAPAAHRPQPGPGSGRRRVLRDAQSQREEAERVPGRELRSDGYDTSRWVGGWVLWLLGRRVVGSSGCSGRALLYTNTNDLNTCCGGSCFPGKCTYRYFSFSNARLCSSSSPILFGKLLLLFYFKNRSKKGRLYSACILTLKCIHTNSLRLLNRCSTRCVVCGCFGGHPIAPDCATLKRAAAAAWSMNEGRRTQDRRAAEERSAVRQPVIDQGRWAGDGAEYQCITAKLRYTHIVE